MSEIISAIAKYRVRLTEIESIDISEYDLDGIQLLCCKLELEMSLLNSETSSLPERNRVSIKQHLFEIIQKYKELLRMIYSFYDLLDKIEAHVCGFANLLLEAKEELELLKSNIHLGNTIKNGFEQLFFSKVKDLAEEAIERTRTSRVG